MPTHKVKRGVVTQPNVLALCHLMKLLQDGTRTIEQLAEESGLNHDTVRKYCRGLKQVGAAFITERRADACKRFTILIYELGHAKDAQRVVRTRAERAREQRHGERIRRGVVPWPPDLTAMKVDA